MPDSFQAILLAAVFLIPGYLVLMARDFVFPRRRESDTARIMQWILWSLAVFVSYSWIGVTPTISGGQDAPASSVVKESLRYAVIASLTGWGIGYVWGTESNAGWYKWLYGFIGRKTPHSTVLVERMDKVANYDDAVSGVKRKRAPNPAYVWLPLEDGYAYWGYPELYNMDPDADPPEVFLRPVHLMRAEDTSGKITIKVVREIPRGVLVRGDILNRMEFTEPKAIILDSQPKFLRPPNP